MGLNNHALWQVAVKALLFNGDGKLLALTTPDGYLDFPGGRTDESERELPWTESLKREIAEELGEAVQFATGDMAFVSKRKYEHREGTFHIAAIYFVCEYRGGDIQLSDEHAEWAWIDPSAIGDYKLMSDDERAQLQAFFSRGNT